MKKYIVVTVFICLIIYITFLNSNIYSSYDECVRTERVERMDRFFNPLNLNDASRIAWDICESKFPNREVPSASLIERTDKKLSQCRKEKIKNLWQEREKARIAGDEQKSSDLDHEIMMLEFKYIANNWLC